MTATRPACDEESQTHLQGISMSTKGDLLEHYATKKAKQFVQCDGFALGRDGGDSVMRPDDDGDCLMSGTTHELMSGSSVRVLIPVGTDRHTAMRILKKIRKWLKREEEHFDECLALPAQGTLGVDSNGIPF